MTFDTNGESPIFYALKLKKLEIAKKMLDCYKGGGIDKSQNNPIQIAIEYKYDDDFIDYLIGIGCDVNHKNKYHITTKDYLENFEDEEYKEKVKRLLSTKEIPLNKI